MLDSGVSHLLYIFINVNYLVKVGEIKKILYLLIFLIKFGFAFTCSVAV